MADVDTALTQKIFDLSQREGVADILDLTRFRGHLTLDG